MPISDLKRRFIDQYTNNDASKATIELLFNRIAVIEDRFGCDLCKFNEDQMQFMCDTVLALRESSKKARLSIIREYIRWCREDEDITIIADIDDILSGANLEGRSKWISQTVGSPGEMKEYLDLAYKSPDKGTMDNVYRGYLWLGFFGVRELDLDKIKTTDVDLESRTIVFGGNVFTICEEAMPEFKNLVNRKTFVFLHPLYSSRKERDRLDSDQLLRGVRGEFDSRITAQVISRMNRKFYQNNILNKKISFSKARLSGLFYRAYLEEKANGTPPDFRAAAMDDLIGRNGSVVTTQEMRWTVNKKAKQYMADYKSWKNAFHGDDKL